MGGTQSSQEEGTELEQRHMHGEVVHPEPERRRVAAAPPDQSRAEERNAHPEPEQRQQVEVAPAPAERRRTGQRSARALDLVRDNPVLQQYMLPNDRVRRTGREIGAGAYGTVEELEVDGLLCAGKTVHPILVREWGSNILTRFAMECSLLSNLRHPHVVTFLGICFIVGRELPTLVMEFLPYDLHSVLDGVLGEISLAMKCSILFDVSLGLNYIHSHSPPVIHRDLTARNILLTSAMAAKIADLGVARVLNRGEMAATMTQAPGTLVYMPPEVLGDHPRYGPSIDIFSFGNIALFTVTQLFPEPTAAVVMDPNLPGRLIGRSEVERRSREMSQLSMQLGEGDPLVYLITHCLDNDPRQRPSAREIMAELRRIRSQIVDQYQYMSKVEMINLLRRRGAEAIQEPLPQLQGHPQEEQPQVAQALPQEFEAQQRLQEEQTPFARTPPHDLEGDPQEKIRSLQARMQEMELEISQRDQIIQERDEAIQALQLRTNQDGGQVIHGEPAEDQVDTNQAQALTIGEDTQGLQDVEETHGQDDNNEPNEPGNIPRRLRNNPQLKHFVMRANLGKSLGGGAFGSVFELRIDGDPRMYAGKQFLESGPFNPMRFCTKFTREFLILSGLRHPNIVCYRGVTFVPQSNFPVLVMERLQVDLHQYLLDIYRSTQSLPVPSQVAMLTNIAAGLEYLHNEGIIHRDLTAKNVLLTHDGIPKISDFGNSRVIDPNSSFEAMTARPGTAVYMPPEALYGTVARYNDKLDVFSFGCLALFTSTQVFPVEILPPVHQVYVDGQPRFEARTEVERRGEYFRMLGREHPLSDLIRQCLSNNSTERPDAANLLQSLRTTFSGS